MVVGCCQVHNLIIELDQVCGNCSDQLYREECHAPFPKLEARVRACRKVDHAGCKAFMVAENEFHGTLQN